jgi:hypothetical protein
MRAPGEYRGTLIAKGLSPWERSSDELIRLLTQLPGSGQERMRLTERGRRGVWRSTTSGPARVKRCETQWSAAVRPLYSGARRRGMTVTGSAERRWS